MHQLFGLAVLIGLVAIASAHPLAALAVGGVLWAVWRTS